MNRFRQIIEWNVFGVCTWFGEKFGISTITIRKYFIYVSFLTMGSPLLIYFFIAFWMNLRQSIGFNKRNPVRY